MTDAIGSRAAVWHGKAHHTSGGLTKKKLMMNKWGRIVSRKKHATAKREKRLENAGFFAKKGSFGVVKKDERSTRKKRASVYLYTNKHEASSSRLKNGYIYR
jgi:hypothetical protein